MKPSLAYPELEQLLRPEPERANCVRFKFRGASGVVILTSHTDGHVWLNVYCRDPRGREKHPLMSLARRSGLATTTKALKMPFEGEGAVFFQAIASGGADRCARVVAKFFRSVGIGSPLHSTALPIRHAFSATAHITFEINRHRVRQ